MSKDGSRAYWNGAYEKALVDILLDHNQSKFRGQNGWTSEGWKSITVKFNEKFPTAGFTKQQVQEKEKELKANYKIIRDARKQSGVGWNDPLGMIVAEPAIWDRLIAAYPKVKKFKNKPFPLYNHLAALYEGSTATGNLNFTSLDHVEAPTSSDQVTVIPIEGEETSSARLEANEVEHAPSATSGHKETHGKKRKQNQVAAVLENYLEFKMEQSKKLVEEPSRAASEYSVGTCVAALESIQELTDEEKSKALRLFKCELNREIFMNTKNSNVRLLWIKGEIDL